MIPFLTPENISEKSTIEKILNLLYFSLLQNKYIEIRYNIGIVRGVLYVKINKEEQ